MESVLDSRHFLTFLYSLQISDYLWGYQAIYIMNTSLFPRCKPAIYCRVQEFVEVKLLSQSHVFMTWCLSTRTNKPVRQGVI
jgi:hypothetical protein